MRRIRNIGAVIAPLKTSLFAPELFRPGGGIPRILRLYLKAVCENSGDGDSVRFLALNDQVVDSAELSRYSTRQLREWRACGGKKLVFVWAAIGMGRTSDVIICGHVAQLPLAWLASRFNGRLRYYLVAHGIEVWRRFTLPERIALRGAEAIWCVSEFTRRQILGHIDISEERLKVVPNALDPGLAPSLRPAEAGNAPVILAVSRLAASEGYKGIDHLIAAMPLILEEIPDAKLRIVGRGDQLPELQALAQRHSVGHAVAFLGYVADAELSAEFAGCRLFALPSEKEGFGIVYLEAMAHGRPCLAARAGGAPEVVSPESGVLVDFGNVEQISKAIVSALRREWRVGPILERADAFSYLRFRERLASLMTP